MAAGFIGKGLPSLLGEYSAAPRTEFGSACGSTAHQASCLFKRATGANVHADVIHAMVNAAR
jgi:hypothetical protein